MQITIYRIEQGKSGTFGCMTLNGEAFSVTLERPWKDNMPNISCIPEGRYRCEPYRSHKFGKCFIVLNVPFRTYILIHPGNFVSESQGCILPGRSFANIDGRRAVTASKAVFSELLKRLDGIDEFELKIATVANY